MIGADVIAADQWSLSTIIGYDHPLFIINKDTLIYTWALLFLLLLICLLCRFLIKKNGLVAFIILSCVEFIVDMTRESLGFFSFTHCAFMATLCLFIAMSNLLSIIPLLDEPTTDINTALALGCLSVFYVQYASLSQKGIKDFIFPLSPMLPLDIIGKLSSIISLSFRLFGNIVSGSIIMGIYLTQLIRSSLLSEKTGMPFYFLGELFGLGVISVIIVAAKGLYTKRSKKEIFHSSLIALFLSPNILMIIYFTLFEGLLHAFVFTMLSFTYLATALQSEESNT